MTKLLSGIHHVSQCLSGHSVKVIENLHPISIGLKLLKLQVGNLLVMLLGSSLFCLLTQGWVFYLLDKFQLTLIATIFIIYLLGKGTILANCLFQQLQGLLLYLFLVGSISLIQFREYLAVLAERLGEGVLIHSEHIFCRHSSVFPKGFTHLTYQFIFIGGTLNTTTKSKIHGTFLVASQLIDSLIGVVLLTEHTQLSFQLTIDFADGICIGFTLIGNLICVNGVGELSTSFCVQHKAFGKFVKTLAIIGDITKVPAKDFCEAVIFQIVKST